MIDVNSSGELATKVRVSDTSFQSPEKYLLGLLAENCSLKLTHCKNREEQQKLILDYALQFTKFNDNPKWNAREFLEEQLVKGGVSKRTILRMLPRQLKDQSKMMNRLGKKKEQTEENSERAAACYQEPD